MILVCLIKCTCILIRIMTQPVTKLMCEHRSIDIAFDLVNPRSTWLSDDVCYDKRCMQDEQLVTGICWLSLQDQKLRDLTMMGSPDVPLEDKMITVVYGTDMVNVNYINFAATSKEVAAVSGLFRIETGPKVKFAHSGQT